MKNAVVLGGGGSRGSYQVGALKAFKELGIEFHVVTGTSIGALNGCLVVQDDYDYLYKLWDSISINDIIIGDFDNDFAIENALFNVDELKHVLIQFKKNKVDITPFKNLITKSFNLEKFSNSTIEYEAIATKVPMIQQTNFTKKDMIKKGVPCLISSASCFPVFPISKIGNNHYIDGGYSDNLPISSALKYNPDTIYVVDLDYNITHESYKKMSNVIYIHPKENIGSFLNFDHDQINKNIQLGYNDVYKYYNKYKGYKYTFNIFSNNNIINEFYKIYLKQDYELFEIYSKEFDIKYSKEDIFYKTIDDILDLMEYNTEYVYDIDTILKAIYNTFYNHLDNNDPKYKDYAEALIKKVVHKSNFEYLLLFIDIYVNDLQIKNVISNTKLQYLAQVITYILKNKIAM